MPKNLLKTPRILGIIGGSMLLIANILGLLIAKQDDLFGDLYILFWIPLIFGVFVIASAYRIQKKPKLCGVFMFLTSLLGILLLIPMCFSFLANLISGNTEIPFQSSMDINGIVMLISIISALPIFLAGVLTLTRSKQIKQNNL